MSYTGNENLLDRVCKIMTKLNSMVMDIGGRELSEEEYQYVYPERIVKTPLGTVKIGENQYEKLNENKRKSLTVAMKFTLQDPVVVLSFMSHDPETETDKEVWIYVKSFRFFFPKLFNDKISYVFTTVIHKENKVIAISTHKRSKEKEIRNKIESAVKILYEKNT